MGFLSAVTTYLVARRSKRYRAAMAQPVAVQAGQLKSLLAGGGRTLYGKEHGLQTVRRYEDFAERLPIVTYEELFPWIERTMAGEPDLLWPGRTRLFAKSSGTTNQRSKYIPVTKPSLRQCHYRGGADMIAMYLESRPGTRVLHGNTLSIGGSLVPNPAQRGSVIGDVSAIIMAELPAWAQRMRSPSLPVALMDNWEDKLEAIARETITKDITSLTGVPTWMLLLCERVLAIAGETDIHNVWPNLEVFIHGAVSFAPYRRLFERMAAPGALRFLETYNASEGFFALQDRPQSQEGEMALMVDYGVFYEFIPIEQFRRGSEAAVPLEGVVAGQEYAMVISTNGGLWRYMIGDTVRFTTTDPYRIVITGRTKHFINAFGEEVVVENAEAALTAACLATAAEVRNYTVAPVYMGGSGQACHEWVVEFAHPPTSEQTFVDVLDKRLREVNSDYDAKRAGSLALHAPRLHAVPAGTFYKWLQSQGKLGGQHKVPRLSNTRQYVEEILQLVVNNE